MRRLLLWLLLPMLLLLLGAELPSRTAKGDDSETAATEKSRKERTELAFFEERIRPVLIDQCYECHSKDADDVGGELLVDSRAGLLEGGQTGPAVVPGDASRSLLI